MTDFVVGLLLPSLLRMLKVSGYSAVVRAGTISESQVARVYRNKKSAAYLNAIEKRDALAYALADFVDALTPDV